MVPSSQNSHYYRMCSYSFMPLKGLCHTAEDKTKTCNSVSFTSVPCAPAAPENSPSPFSAWLWDLQPSPTSPWLLHHLWLLTTPLDPAGEPHLLFFKKQIKGSKTSEQLSPGGLATTLNIPFLLSTGRLIILSH